MEEIRPFMELASDRARSSEKTTSSAVKAAPSWKVTPSRSLNVHTEGLSGSTDQSVASVASSSPSGFLRISGSIICCCRAIVTPSFWPCGSSVSASLARAQRSVSADAAVVASASTSTVVEESAVFMF